MSDQVSTPVGLSVRVASAEDAELLWRWANEPTVRANAFHRDAIPWESHVAWFGKRLASQECRFYILEQAGRPVGQIRYDRDEGGEAAEISFSVPVEARGQGYGIELILRTRELALRDLGVRTITALVFPGNEASRRAFLRTGFTELDRAIIRGRECYRFAWRPETTDR